MRVLVMKFPKEIYKILLDLFPGINEYLLEERKIQICILF